MMLSFFLAAYFQAQISFNFNNFHLLATFTHIYESFSICKVSITNTLIGYAIPKINMLHNLKCK